MIYISSGCVRANRIGDAVRFLVDRGFKNIELSGGTDFYVDYVNDLQKLKNNYGLSFSLHNYFPPPRKHFVLNLASLNNDVFNSSIENCKKALDLSQELGASKYGIHAGFLIDPKVDELGRKIKQQKHYDKQKAMEQFAKGLRSLKEYSDSIEIYVENNVFSTPNIESFGYNPFLFTDFRSYTELREFVDFKILLDWAHLKVSCNTLGIDFGEELNRLAPLSDYYHLSDNDGLTAANHKIEKESILFEYLSSMQNANQTLTLEIYDGIDAVEETYRFLKDLYEQ